MIVELGAGQLGELGLGEGIDGGALGMEGKSVHEREFLHLLERVAVVEVAGDEEFRAGDLGVVEVLAAGGFGEELEDIVEAGVLDDEAIIGFLHFLFFLFERAERSGYGWGVWSCLGGGRQFGGSRQIGGGWQVRGFFRGIGRATRQGVTPGIRRGFCRGSGRCGGGGFCGRRFGQGFFGWSDDRFDQWIGRSLGVEPSCRDGGEGVGDQLCGFHNGSGLAVLRFIGERDARIEFEWGVWTVWNHSRGGDSTGSGGHSTREPVEFE